MWSASRPGRPFLPHLKKKPVLLLGDGGWRGWPYSGQDSNQLLSPWEANIPSLRRPSVIATAFNNKFTDEHSCTCIFWWRYWSRVNDEQKIKTKKVRLMANALNQQGFSVGSRGAFCFFFVDFNITLTSLSNGHDHDLLQTLANSPPLWCV